eukprot:scaffold3410_cov141-Cylindrotheca_fusiformis.AAC.9
MHSFKSILCLLAFTLIAIANGEEGSGCPLCPDGMENPDRKIEVGGVSVTCSGAALTAELLGEGSTCDAVIEAYTGPCCPASAISSMIALIATAWIGYMVAF